MAGQFELDGFVLGVLGMLSHCMIDLMDELTALGMMSQCMVDMWKDCWAIEVAVFYWGPSRLQINWEDSFSILQS